jgi:membrane protease YdiL (CAAX protease family)
MSPMPPFAGKMRAYLEFIAAIIYCLLARSTAHRIALRHVSDDWLPLAEQAILLVLLLAIFSAFGRLFDHEKNPLAEQGLSFRAGWPREAGTGLAIGWGAATACVLIMAIVGGIAIVLTTDRSTWGAWLVDVLFFAIAAMAEEVTFRGYGFQRFLSVVGPVGAVLGFAAFYAGLQALLPGANRASVAVSVVFSLVLSLAYLRTRALWVGWGLNFGWKASRALIFGLTVSGISSHSSVVEGDPMGPFWLTGGGYGLDASWFAFLILLGTIPIVYRVTRELDFRHNAPVIVPGGVPVDLDAAAQRQHEAYISSVQAAPPPLVQILPSAAPPPSNQAEKDPGSERDPSL